MQGNDPETMAPPRRFLTDDEGVAFLTRDRKEITYRLRTWRARDATPVVLATTASHRIEATPGILSSKIANYAVRALAHPACGILYFEAAPSFGFCPSGALYQIHFEEFGRGDRARLINASRREVEWGHLESIVGEEVER